MKAPPIFSNAEATEAISGALLTTRQVCDLLQVTKLTIERWEKAGKIHAVRFSRSTKRFKASEINRLIADGET